LESDVAHAETDIVSLKMIEEELQFANTLLSTQTESSPDGILVIGANSRVISFNQRYVDIFGLSVDVLHKGRRSHSCRRGAALMIDPEAFLARVRYFFEHPEEEGRDELETNDGRFFDRHTKLLRVRGTPLAGERTHLRFEIHDTGIGIPAGAKAKLFAPFIQADPSITRRFGGTGLRLNISKKLVELMGGQIGFADRLGGGTVFWFEVTLPNATLVGADHGVPENAHGVRPAAAVSGGIVLAEDNNVNVEVATLILEGVRYTVDVATDGFEAVAAVRCREYGLILTDMQMPGMDGISATREIRAFEESEKRVPIIAMTANARAEDQRRCLEAGMDDYVSKPIAPAKLRETVARWMKANALPATAPSIDPTAIEALPVIEQDVVDPIQSCMDESKFSSLMELYIAQAEEQSQQFQQWRSSLTLGEIGDEAHKIISSAGALGSRRAQDLAGLLQTVCRAGDEASMPGLLDQLTSASAAASSPLRKMLAA
jgi:CheY-like chemotaxis protein/PAS domain-containing protein/HPt (histidine-containing phosphotransfer) domain-containing protein